MHIHKEDVAHLCDAVWNDSKPAICRKLVQKCGKAIITAFDSSGSTAMHLAAGNGRTELLEWFLLQEINYHTLDKVGRTALIEAVLNGHLACVQLLLRAGASAAVRDKEGKTALDYARERSNLPIIALLEERADFLDAQRCIKPAVHETEQLPTTQAAAEDHQQPVDDSARPLNLLELSSALAEDAQQEDDAARAPTEASASVSAQVDEAVAQPHEEQQRHADAFVPVMDLGLTDLDLQLAS
eukprot:m.249029 g.249029  ORF g.249029 m.249029 type:complete len:242 (+) comp54494_c0_seq3:498-1223(+)